MKIGYLCFILYLQISLKKGTIDINIPEYLYIADHLSAEECRRLYASLHYMTYELPQDLPEAEKLIPEDVPCIKLLMQWNVGDEKFEGGRKTHHGLERRLRQIGKTKIADWLGDTVFHDLGKELNESHAKKPSTLQQGLPKGLKVGKLKSKLKTFGENWTTIDTILCVVLVGLLFVTVSAFIRMLRVSFSKASSSKDKDEEEMIDLLSQCSADSDQENSQHKVNVAKSTSICQVR